jgi:hypothetical protein
MITYIAIDLFGSKRVYHGSTTNFKRRQTQHLTSSENYPFQNALKQRQFYWICSDDDGLDDRSEEQFYLDFYFGSPWSFNLNPIASSPPRVPEKLPKEWAEAISRGSLGKTIPKETFEKGWETRRKNGNDLHSLETKRQMSKAHTGRKHSVESIEKRKEKLKGREGNAKGSKWFVNLETGETQMAHNHPGEGWIPGRKL